MLSGSEKKVYGYLPERKRKYIFQDILGLEAYRIAIEESGYSRPLYSINGSVPSWERTCQSHITYAKT